MSLTIQNIAPDLAHLFFEENQDFKAFYPEGLEYQVLFTQLTTTIRRRFSILKYGRGHFMRAEINNDKVHLIFVDDYAFSFAYYFCWLKELDYKYRDLIFPHEFITEMSDIDYLLVDQDGNLTKTEAVKLGVSTYTFFLPFPNYFNYDIFLAVKQSNSTKADLLIRFNLLKVKTKTNHNKKWKTTFDPDYHEYYNIFEKDIKNRIGECSEYSCTQFIYIHDYYKSDSEKPANITLTQTLLPYYYSVYDYVKSIDEFILFMRKAIDEHKTLNALSDEIYRHFDSNYPPHMLDATTLKMAKLATEIASQFCYKTPESESQNIYEQIKELHRCRKDIK